MADKSHFLDLFLANEAGIRAAVRALVRDRNDFDDTFQAVALALWKKFGTYDATRPFGAWARGVVVKEVLQVRRATGRRPTPFSPEAVQAILDAFERQSTTDNKSRSAEFEALEHCIGALPGRWKQLLDLRYRDSLSLKDMSERLERTLAATQRDLSRARQRVAECIQQKLASWAEGKL